MDLRILIGTDGVVKKVRVLSGLPLGLTQSAIKTAFEMKFAPALINQQPVEYWSVVSMDSSI